MKIKALRHPRLINVSVSLRDTYHEVFEALQLSKAEKAYDVAALRKSIDTAQRTLRQASKNLDLVVSDGVVPS